MKDILLKHLPEQAIAYCHQLWLDYPFHFKTATKRSTKLGDYRYFPRDKSHTITVNNDLNLYSFLVTYIHEVAHRVAFEDHGRKIKPHGIEWKQTFKHLMLPLLNNDVFPEDIIRPLAAYLKNPAATTHANIPLLQSLRAYDANDDLPINTLAEIEQGQLFTFKKRTFEKMITKRTRVVCREIVSNRNYLISGMAEVELLHH
jgi:hypothetical protein